MSINSTCPESSGKSQNMFAEQKKKKYLPVQKPPELVPATCIYKSLICCIQLHPVHYATKNSPGWRRRATSATFWDLFHTKEIQKK